MNEPLTATDLVELERMLVDSGIGEAEDIQRAAEEAEGLRLFVRSLVGLDRGAAKEALAAFLGRKAFNANQIEFVNMIIDHLTEHGVTEAATLYESPFTDLSPRGPDEILGSTDIDHLITVIGAIRDNALAA